MGLAERSCSDNKLTDSMRRSWLDSNLQVGDNVIEVNGVSIQQWLMRTENLGSELGVMEVKLLRRHPSLSLSSNSSDIAPPPELLSSTSEGASEESSTQSKTQLCESSDNESEGGLSDLDDDDDGANVNKLVVNKEIVSSVIDMDLKRQVGCEEAAQSLHRLFAKKVPQVVVMWVGDVPESSWEELCSRRRNFDKLRLQYTAHFITTLTCDIGSTRAIIDEEKGIDKNSTFKVNSKHRLQIRDTFDRILGYLLNVKDAKRDRITTILTSFLLAALSDTNISIIFDHTFEHFQGKFVSKSVISALMASAYDRYLVATDPNIFALSDNSVEKRCSSCLIAAVRLVNLQNPKVLPLPSLSSSSSVSLSSSESSSSAKITETDTPLVPPLAPLALISEEGHISKKQRTEGQSIGTPGMPSPSAATPSSGTRRRWSQLEKETLKRAVGVCGEVWQQVWELCGEEEPGMTTKWSPQEMNEKWKKLKVESVKQHEKLVEDTNND
jgi:hypothetical protein